jgi:hypothetical protein
LLCGLQFTHEIVRDREARRVAAGRTVAPKVQRESRTPPVRGQNLPEGEGKWSYLYRAIDGAGNPIDSMVSATRHMATAQRFFCRAISIRATYLDPIWTLHIGPLAAASDRSLAPNQRVGTPQTALER